MYEQEQLKPEEETSAGGARVFEGIVKGICAVGESTRLQKRSLNLKGVRGTRE